MSDESDVKINMRLDFLEKHMNDHEDRIRSIEKSNIKLAVYVGVIMGIVEVFAQYLIRTVSP